MIERVRPPALKPGDTVAVVAIAAAVEREHLERGANALAACGYRVKVSERALDRSGILAGGDRERAAELFRYFEDPAVKAIFAARGGYGCGRLLPLFDFEKIARRPKIFMGFSDATFLLNALVESSRMIAFHGPMVSTDFARGLSPRALDHLRRLLSGEGGSFELQAREALHPGVAEGELIGGCLSVLVAMLGTPYTPDFNDKVLFLEDTGEKAYRVDRMLVHLKQAGALERVAGVVFGGMRGFDGSEQEKRLMREFMIEQTAGLGCPVIAGIEVGHGTENLAIPFGVRVRLEAEKRRLTFLEKGVS
ncbi:MAG TPA: LD-carboxypeptidase [Candidatus Binataceae bacterium]|nr:LD-carboxypeptidase [Candidatus Binataceae bacterium]